MPIENTITGLNFILVTPRTSPPAKIAAATHSVPLGRHSDVVTDQNLFLTRSDLVG